MVAKSHIDLCMFVQVLEVSEADIPGSMADVARARSVRGIARYLEQNPGTKFIDSFTELHESIHTAQAIVYPFFRWYSMMTWVLVFRAFKELSLQEDDFLDPTNLAFHPSFFFPTTKFHVAVVPRHRRSENSLDHLLYVALERDDLPAESDFLFSLNAIDLMENAASLIQYKISQSNDSPAYDDYIRWTKRNPATAGLVLKLARMFGNPQLLVDAFLALVQAAFHTNNPVRAFMLLFLILEKRLHRGALDEFISFAEPRRWVEYFDALLDELEFDHTDLGDLTYRSFFRLDPWTVSNLRVAGKMGHPILGKATREWGERERANAGHRYALTLPNGHAHLFTVRDSIFNAPVRIIKFKLSNGPLIVLDGNLEATGIADVQEFGVELRPTDLRASLRDFMVIFGYVRGQAGAMLDTNFHLCGHFSCRHYDRNLCNSWIHVPEDFERCGFPSHIVELASRWRQKEGR